MIRVLNLKEEFRSKESPFVIQIHLGFCLFFLPEGGKLRQYQYATNANQDPVLKPRLHELAMVMRFFHGMSFIQTSFIRDHSHKLHLVSSLFVSLSVGTFCVLTDPP